MPWISQNLRTSQQIKAEIEQTFGFLPPFFEPALESPQVLENLWQQTLSAYVENPFSALFKEKINALLSRFCAAPYCMIVHSAALRPLGMTARQVLSLLETQPSEEQKDVLPLGVLPVPKEAAAPLPESALEKTLLYCAVAVFLERADAEPCQVELLRLLGPALYPHLVTYLAYIKTCHTWIEAHPSVSHEADQRAVKNLGPLMAEEPALAEFFSHYQERLAGIQRSRVSQAAMAAERRQADAAIRTSEEKLRLLVDGAKDYAMLLLDTQGRITSWNKGAERIFGWSEAEVLDLPGALIFTPDDRAAGIVERELGKASVEGKTMDLRWHVRKDGSRFFADGIMECLRDEDGHLCGFAKILRDATAMRRAEEERRQVQEELDEAHQRTRDILGSITDAFMAFDADWRFTYVNDQSERIMSRVREDLLGRVFWDEFPAAVGSTFERQYRRAMDEQTTVTFEEFYPPLNVWVEVRAFPSSGGLSVFYRDISERKMLERERELLAEREHNIASQLQTALQPELPGAVQGLAISRYYEAALSDEAGVGGDFFDVFAVEKGCTALVLGDLSGKGLAAAAQVSIVRNMMRAFLYSKPTVVEAVSDLNRVLVKNNLLTGFSTLFVGTFDAATRELRYVNCGQEPALVRRGTTGAVEELSPTGPILGSIESARYTEETVILIPGDALAIFSDGLTEVGPTRKAMLGIEGVAALLGAPIGLKEVESTTEMAEHLALRLIAGVDEAAQGGVMRDDVCLLVVVVEGGTSGCIQTQLSTDDLVALNAPFAE